MTTEDAHYLLRLVAEQDERNQQIRSVLVNFLMRKDGARDNVVPFPPRLRVNDGPCGCNGYCPRCEPDGVA